MLKRFLEVYDGSAGGSLCYFVSQRLDLITETPLECPALINHIYV